MNTRYSGIALVWLAAALLLTACGGGGGSSGASPAITGTAAQYFTQTAVGNTWSWIDSSTEIATPAGGSATTYNSTGTSTSTVTALTGGVQTVSDASTTNGVANPTTTRTRYLDSAGALIGTNSTGTHTILPATFGVGTTWTEFPAHTSGSWSYSAVQAQVVGFNVTRTVPAGTFTDCLEIRYTYTAQYGSSASVTNLAYSITVTRHISATTGSLVDSTGTYTFSGIFNGVSYTGSGTSTSVLQPGYIANP